MELDTNTNNNIVDCSQVNAVLKSRTTCELSRFDTDNGKRTHAVNLC